MNCTEVMYGSGDVMNGSWGNCTNSTLEDDEQIDLPKAGTLVIIIILSLIGNICTIAVISSFKIHRIPDVLVIGLACTDLVTTLIPVSMSLYSYVTLTDYEEGSFSCILFATMAQFTRYSSALIVTLVSVERYLAVNRPFLYRKYASPKRFIFIMFVCWLIALGLAIIPALDDGTPISAHDGFCLFDFTSNYAYAVLGYSGVQYVVVFVCFVLVMAKLIRVHRRRKLMKVQGDYNRVSRAGKREQLTFTKPSITTRISDIGKSLARAAPAITEKFQLGVEAQFARMLFAVMALFYISWTTTVILIIIAIVKDTEDGLSTALFWGIRLTVVSTAINPFLYGLLARQYRMAYVYVLRLCFNKCCGCCVDPPLKDVFASARTPGGEVRRESQVRHGRNYDASRYGSHGKLSVAGSLWSKGSSGVPVLTRQTNISLPELNRIHHDVYLSTIQEVTVCDHSTYVPSAGELASTVIIPDQARDRHPSHSDSNTHRNRRSVSFEDMGGTFLHDLGPTDNPPPGSHNLLAYVVDMEEDGVFVDGDRIRELGAAEAGTTLDMGKVYGNPVYEFERTRRGGGGHQRGNATPSTDDGGSTEALIPQGVIRKTTSFTESPLLRVHPSQKTETSRRSLNLHRTFNTSESPKKPRETTEMTLTEGGDKDLTDDEVDRVFEEVDILVRAAVSDTRRLQTAALDRSERTSKEGVKGQTSTTSNQTPAINRLSQETATQLHDTISPSYSQSTVDQSNTQTHTHKQTHMHKQTDTQSVPAVTGSPQSVQDLKSRFEAMSPTPPTSPSDPITSSVTGRRLSTDNSDSGRESMIFDHDISTTAIDIEPVLL